MNKCLSNILLFLQVGRHCPITKFVQQSLNILITHLMVGKIYYPYTYASIATFHYYCLLRHECLDYYSQCGESCCINDLYHIIYVSQRSVSQCLMCCFLLVHKSAKFMVNRMHMFSFIFPIFYWISVSPILRPYYTVKTITTVQATWLLQPIPYFPSPIGYRECFIHNDLQHTIFDCSDIQNTFFYYMLLKVNGWTAML